MRGCGRLGEGRPMDMSQLAGAALSGLFALVSVALWTLRVALTAAGRRPAAAGVAGLEAVAFTVAFGRIVENLDNVVGIVAYAMGVAGGTLLGVMADERLSTGQSWVRVIVEGGGDELAGALRGRRWPVTTLEGVGPTGRVTELVVAVDDTSLPALLRDVDETNPAAFRAVERLRSSRGRPVPGYRQVGARARAGGA